MSYHFKVLQRSHILKMLQWCFLAPTLSKINYLEQKRHLCNLFSNRCILLKNICIVHTCFLRVLFFTEVKNDHRSKFSNLSNWKEEAWKNQGFNGIRTRDLREKYRCDALPTELWSHTLGARSIYWVHNFPCSEVLWSIYEIYTSTYYILYTVMCWASPLEPFITWR